MILGYPTQTYANPTQLRLGMPGNFSGRTYNVIGRAVLGEMEYGRIYYWNEFYLETDGQEIVTLVYEQTTLGGEWRWFTMFDPPTPLTAAEAATKRPGNTVDLDGVNARITLVNESRVYFMEGRGPEGVKPGARANYFNATSGSKLVVVSWTGEEVEFFRGTNLSPGMVASAFGLHTGDLVKFHVAESSSSSSSVGKILGAVIFVLGLFFILSTHCNQSSSPPAAVVRNDIPMPALKTGSSGTLRGANYRVEGHADVEIAEMDHLTLRHEFFLHDSDGNDALLVYGWKTGTTDWLLLTPLHPTVPLTSQQAAKVKSGETVNVDGVVAPANDLFRSTVIHSEDVNEPDSYTGDLRYGFSGQAGSVYLLTRWNEHGIVFYQGRAVPDKEVTGAFGLPAAK